MSTQSCANKYVSLISSDFSRDVLKNICAIVPRQLCPHSHVPINVISLISRDFGRDVLKNTCAIVPRQLCPHSHVLTNVLL